MSHSHTSSVVQCITEVVLVAMTYSVVDVEGGEVVRRGDVVRECSCELLRYDSSPLSLLPLLHSCFTCIAYPLTFKHT